MARQDRIIVFSSLFPSTVSPTSGTFIKERLFRVHQRDPIVVVAPQLWSPIDRLGRFIRPNFRPQAEEYEVVDGVEVFRPRCFSVPGIAKTLDGRFMLQGAWKIVEKLSTQYQIRAVDAHFLYPDGWAAAGIAQRLGVPLTITIRGSKDEWLIGTSRERYLVDAMKRATRLFAVSAALKQDVAIKLGIDSKKVEVIGNGVDLTKFTRESRSEARRRLGISENRKVVIGVGSLIERKGFHLVIPVIDELRKKYPSILYLIVGGGASHGDMSNKLREQISHFALENHVQLCGPKLPTELKWFYSASDVFALATAHEGWANVFLEAMACGLPIVSTRVGGNSEVVASENFGLLAEFFDSSEFTRHLDKSLEHHWDREAIVNYAKQNTWDARIDRLHQIFSDISPVK